MCVCVCVVQYKRIHCHLFLTLIITSSYASVCMCVCVHCYCVLSYWWCCEKSFLIKKKHISDEPNEITMLPNFPSGLLLVWFAVGYFLSFACLFVHNSIEPTLVQNSFFTLYPFIIFFLKYFHYTLYERISSGISPPSCP